MTAVTAPGSVTWDDAAPERRQARACERARLATDRAGGAHTTRGVVTFERAEEMSDALPSVWRRDPGRQTVLQELRRFACRRLLGVWGAARA